MVVSPGAGFGPAGEGYLRLALVENENRLRQAVRQIGRCLDKRYPRRTARGAGGENGLDGFRPNQVLKGEDLVPFFLGHQLAFLNDNVCSDLPVS